MTTAGPDLHPAISVNTLCFADGDLSSRLARVVRLGVRGISPDLVEVLEFGVGEAARLIRDAGLQVATITHRSFSFATPAEVVAGRERLERTIAIAVEIGAQSIIMTTGGRGELDWPQAADRFAAAMAPCAELARQAGIALGIEPTSHLYADASIVHRLIDTLRLARLAGISPVIDIFACWFDADIEQAIAEAAPLAPLIQVSDYVYGDRGLPCRAVPGDGAIPFPRLIPALVHAGFRGWFDLEIIGPRLLAEGEHAGLARAANYIDGLLTAAENEQ